MQSLDSQVCQCIQNWVFLSVVYTGHLFKTYHSTYLSPFHSHGVFNTVFILIAVNHFKPLKGIEYKSTSQSPFSHVYQHWCTLDFCHIIYSALLWQKEASDKSEISCKRATCVCHFHWRQWNIMMSCLTYLLAGWVFMHEICTGRRAHTTCR